MEKKYLFFPGHNLMCCDENIYLQFRLSSVFGRTDSVRNLFCSDKQTFLYALNDWPSSALLHITIKAELLMLSDRIHRYYSKHNIDI